MSSINQTTVALVGAGGTSPYTFTLVASPTTTIPVSINGSVLTVDASTLAPGTYEVGVQITDQLNTTHTKQIAVEVISAATFAILNRDVSFEPATFPLATTLPLTSIGGTGTVVWSLLPNVTTVTGASISGTTLSFSLSSFGEWTVGLRATDSLGNTATRLITLSIATSTVVSVVDGHAILKVAATAAEIGKHNFTLAVADSASSLKRSTFQYSVLPATSTVEVEQTGIDHFWGSGDTSSIVYPIAGDLSGFSLGTPAVVTAANGLTATVDITSRSLIVTGPPTSFGNSEIDLILPILQAGTQVATVTREFTLVSHSGLANATLGSMTCSTRPYIVGIGEIVGLNPLRPFFNSPAIFKNASYTVGLAVGSTLPLGLSLDAVTGLIYGSVLADDVASSVLEYVDADDVVRGTVTVVWDIVTCAFHLTDSIPDGQLQTAFTGSIATSSLASLATVTVYRGSLPTGLSLGISGNQMSVVLSGSPTQAGFFDLWIQVANANGQTACLYKRLAIDYVIPLVIVTSSLTSLVTGTASTQTLNAVGGVQPYTWSLLAGTLPAGMTLDPNSGILSGTPTASSYSQQLTFQVTDSRAVTASSVLPLAINNTLTITTPVLPVITPGTIYRFAMQSVGGQGGNEWSLGAGSAALPGGITLNTSGFLSGATSLESYTANLILEVTDSANNLATKTYTLTIGSSFGLLIDIEGIGPIIRGSAYHGTLKVIGNGIAPFSWGVTTDSPQQLPSGFTLVADTSTSGVTATLAGSSTATLLNDSVKIEVIDANGNTAFAFLMLDTYSTLAIATTSLAQATVTGAYSQTLTVSGLNPAYVWSLDSTSPALPSGMTFSSTGVLSGTPSVAADVYLVFRVTDALGDYALSILEFQAIASTFTIDTISLPGATAGVAYTAQLVAHGGVTPYTYSLSPNSPNLFPSYLVLNATTGAISGTTLAYGLNRPITFRFTDAIGVIRETTLTLAVNAAIVLQSGPDYIQTTTLNSLGIVADGDVAHVVANNLSFMVVATQCISTSISGFSFGLPTGFTAACLSLSGGVAYFKLSGPFGAAGVGVHNFSFSVSDSGVNSSKTFQWTVFTQTALTMLPISGSLPQIYS